MKKLLIFILAIALAMTMAFSFSSCSDSGKSGAGVEDVASSIQGPPNYNDQSQSEMPSQSESESESEEESSEAHTHNFTQEAVSEEHLKSAATCTEKALYFYSCECGENGTEYFEAGEANGHTFVSGVCSACSEKATYTRDGSKITFGSYPQSCVTDSDILSALNAKAGDLPTKNDAKTWTSYGYYISEEVTNYMWFIDITEGDDKYRGVYFTKYRPWGADLESETDVTVQDDNGYELNTVYWFKYEPLTWTVLKEDNGSAMILCDYIIDAQAFDYNNGVTRNNYKSSTVRAWLNDTFYETAFNDTQKGIIMTTTVNNAADTTGYNPNNYACADTEDKIFLISRAEATDLFENGADRGKETTDYAKSQGSINIWWLRSPYKSSGLAGVVENYGTMDRDYTECTNRGIVPALWLTLSE